MEDGGFESGYGSRFQAVARKLLAGKAEPTPAALAPSPAPAAYMCRDLKTGMIVNCQNPHTLIIIVAGMSCMMFLVTIAMLLLCWSVVRQRRLERRRRESGADQPITGIAPSLATNPAMAPTVPVDSREYDDAVFVQLPGDKKPQFFALPKPFLTDGDKGATKPADVADDGKSGEKEVASEAGENHNHNHNAAGDSDPCVQSSDGLYRNPLFASR